MIGKPGATVFQMNGQPTAQNTRECGVNGEFVAFRNWNNPEHVADTARIWNVEPSTLPDWTPPTHAMQIFHLAESGSIRFLWIMATNPAVSMPELARIHEILAQEDLFVIVSDAFLTETAALADVVLPAAIWGEKTGCVTNVDRTVHLAEQGRSIRPARLGPTSTSSSTTHGGWTSATRTALRSSSGPTPPARSMPGRPAAAAGRATTPE